MDGLLRMPRMVVRIRVTWAPPFWSLVWRELVFAAWFVGGLAVVLGVVMGALVYWGRIR